MIYCNESYMKKSSIYLLFLLASINTNSYADKVTLGEVDYLVKNRYGLEAILRKFPPTGKVSAKFTNDNDIQCLSIKDKKIINSCLEDSDFTIEINDKYIERFKNEDLCIVLGDIKRNKDYKYKRNIAIIEALFKYFKVLITKEARHYLKCINKNVAEGGFEFGSI